MRIALVHEGTQLLNQAAAEAHQSLVAFSIVLSKEITREAVGPVTLHPLRDRLSRQLQRLDLPFPTLISGIDVSLNEGLGQRPSWQPQLYGVTLAENAQYLHDAFNHRTTHVHRPVRFRDVTDLASALTYSAKTEFVRRSSYRDKVGRRNTQKFGLSTGQERHVALWLWDAKTWETMILLGLARRGPRLVALRSARASSSRTNEVQKVAEYPAVFG